MPDPLVKSKAIQQDTFLQYATFCPLDDFLLYLRVNRAEQFAVLPEITAEAFLGLIADSAFIGFVQIGLFSI